jgi:hypothetical protein
MRRWPRRTSGTLAVLAALAAPALAACGVPVGQVSPGPLQEMPVPAHPAWVSSAPFGSWNNSGFIVYNNEWNTAAAGPQRIWADTFQDWGVASRQAATDSVKTYPSVQRNFENVPVSSFSQLRSSFAESMPDASRPFGAEAAYDLWLENGNFEVMIWVDNHWRTPAGSQVARVMLNHQQFDVFQNGNAMFSFTLTGRWETAGKVNILAFLSWLVGHHYLPASAGVSQVDFGWEIASTNGVPLTFRMRRYSLAAVIRPEKSP